MEREKEDLIKTVSDKCEQIEGIQVEIKKLRNIHSSF